MMFINLNLPTGTCWEKQQKVKSISIDEAFELSGKGFIPTHENWMELSRHTQPAVIADSEKGEIVLLRLDQKGYISLYPPYCYLERPLSDTENIINCIQFEIIDGFLRAKSVQTLPTRVNLLTIQE